MKHAALTAVPPMPSGPGIAPNGSPTRRRLRRLRRKLHWERGYRAHLLRDGKDRVHGRIDLEGSPPTYRWGTTAGMRGTARTLAAARAAVEQVVRCGMHQLDLFASLELVQSSEQRPAA